VEITWPNALSSSLRLCEYVYECMFEVDASRILEVNKLSLLYFTVHANTQLIKY